MNNATSTRTGKAPLRGEAKKTRLRVEKSTVEARKVGKAAALLVIFRREPCVIGDCLRAHLFPNPSNRSRGGVRAADSRRYKASRRAKRSAGQYVAQPMVVGAEKADDHCGDRALRRASAISE